MRNYKIFVISILFFISSYSNASTTVGSWDVGSAVVNGATTTYTATKEIAGKIATGVAKITPTPAQIAKGLSKGLFAGLAMSVAQKLVEDGVDFVFDTANSELRYTPISDKNKIYQYKYTSTRGTAYTLSEAQSISDQYLEKTYSTSVLKYSCYVESDGGFFCPYRFTSDSETAKRGITFTKEINKEYDSKATSESIKKSIPFSTFASSIITEADKDDEQAKAITTSVAQSATASSTEDQLVPATQLTQALDASVATEEDETKPSSNTNTNTNTQDQSQTDESTSSPATTGTSGGSSFELPGFCSWATTVCTFFEYVKAQYLESVATIKDFFTTKDESTEIDLDNDDNSKTDTNFSFSSQCPVPLTLIDTDAFGGTKIDFDFSPFCDFLVTWVRPMVIFTASLLAVYILGARNNA